MDSDMYSITPFSIRHYSETWMSLRRSEDTVAQTNKAGGHTADGTFW